MRTAEQKIAVADYTRRALIALGEVEDALTAERVLAERERILGDAAAAGHEATRMEQDAYRIGKSDLRAVNQRQLAEWAADVALLNVRRERLVRRIDLHLAPVAASARRRWPPPTQTQTQTPHPIRVRHPPPTTDPDLQGSRHEAPPDCHDHRHPARRDRP